MDEIREYILSVICVAVICALVQHIVPGSGSVQAVTKLVMGILLSIAVLRPFVQLENLNFHTILPTIAEDSQMAIQEGEQAALYAMSGSIKEKLESYILNKANALGMEVQVEITTANEIPPVPESATISGSVSPYSKRQLAEYMRAELGIAEENQIWIS